VISSFDIFISNFVAAVLLGGVGCAFHRLADRASLFSCRRQRVTRPNRNIALPVVFAPREEAVPIAARKQELLMQAARIAKRAADRVEDQIGDAPLPQAVVTFGIMTDKINLLSGDPTIHIQHSIGQPDRNPNWLYERLQALQDQITASAPKPLEATVVEPVTPQPALPNGENISGSGR
jgi:hypothetical protein